MVMKDGKPFHKVGKGIGAVYMILLLDARRFGNRYNLSSILL
jgi:hypothetical protein